jgi:autotransporter-associated beta strand protein
MLRCKPSGTGFAFSPTGLTLLFYALISLATVQVSLGATWTWNGNGGNVNWTTIGNWDIASAPASLATTDLIFSGGNNTGTALVPLNLNIASPFLLNSLTFSNVAGSFFLGGGAFRFDGGSTNTIIQGSSNAQNIANAINAPSTNASVTLTLAGTGTGVVTMSGVIAGGSGQRDYAIVKNGTSTFSLSGSNSYRGGTTINGGTLIVNSDASLGIGGALTLNAGTLEVATGFTSARTITLSNAASTFQIDPLQTFTLTSAMTGSGALNKTGNGTMILQGANTFGGGTIVSAGILQLAAADRLLSTGALTISGGTFDLQTFAETSGVVTLSSGSIIGSGTLTGSDYLFQTGSVSVPLAGVAALTKSGAGTVTLSGASSYSGGTTINGGTLSVSSSANLGSLAGGLTINAGTLEIATGFTTGRAISLGNSASTFQIDAGQTYTVTSAIGGTGTLNKTGAGTMVVSGSNTFSGGTVVSAGTLQLGSSERLFDTGALNISGGSFDLRTFTETTGGVTLSSGSIVGTGAGTLTGSAYTFQSGTVSAIIAGTGTVTKNTSGLVTLSGNNTYSGSTTIAAGILQVNSNNALGTTASGTTVANGADLNLNNVSYTTAEPLTLNGSGISNGGALSNSGTSTFAGPINAATNATINAGGGTLNLTGGISKNGTTLTFAGGGTVNITTNGITGSSPNSDLVVDGTTVVLSAASSYNGPTTIQNSGTLKLGGNNVLPGSPQTAMTVNTGSTFDLASYSDGVASLTGDSSAIVKNSVAGGTSTFTVNPANGVSTTFAGVIAGTNGGTQGDVALQKNGAGTLVLTGANTFSGTTTINGGTLTVAAPSGSALGATSNVLVNWGATLLLGANNQINNTATMTLAGGTFAKGDFGAGSASSAGVGALSLTASGSTIDFGTGAVGVLSFASFAPGAFTLTITNWTGAPGIVGSGTTDRLIFASDQIANLGNFVFTGFGSGAREIDLGNGHYEIVAAVPEPSTFITAALTLLPVGLRLARRRRKQTQGA